VYENPELRKITGHLFLNSQLFELLDPILTLERCACAVKWCILKKRWMGSKKLANNSSGRCRKWQPRTNQRKI